MENIRIGADELILWLRKNNKAIKVSNDEIQGLGIKIYKIIVEQLSGEKVEDNIPSYWACSENDKNVGKYNLPVTSAQYKIDIDKMSALYRELNKMQ